MDIDKFLSINYINYNGTLIMELKVNHPIPTQLQWTFAKEELKENIANLAKTNNKFGFLFDISIIGLVSLTHVKEFTQIMMDNADFLEEKLYASSAIADGVIIKNVFDVVNLFYKTKKPLKIVNNKEEALLFIKSHHIN
jgi:hypothetical protein